MKGVITCVQNCSDTKNSCESQSDNFYNYTWTDPQPGKCCGECSKTPSKIVFKIIF